MVLDFTEELITEAESRTHNPKFTYAFSQIEKSISDSLFQEAASRIEKTAMMEKAAMAAQIGVKDIRNSTANTVFEMPQFSEDPNSIEHKLYDAYKKYFYTRIDGRKVDVNAGIFIPEAKKKYKHEPFSHLRIEFPFTRHVMPTNKEFAQSATSAVDAMDKVIPGFKTFVGVLESSDIPVLPYYHTTVRSIARGGVNTAEAKDFISSEYGKEIILPNGSKLPTARFFYATHQKMMQSGQDPQMTIQAPHHRRYSRDYVFGINIPAVLLNAISNKIQQGYWIDWNALKKDLHTRINKLMQLNKAAETGTKREVYTSYYRKFYQSLVDAFNSGTQSLRAPDEPYYHTWGKMRGLKVNNLRNKHVAPATLSTLHLKLALYHMTQHLPRKATTPVTVGPNEFTVPDHKLTYASNGFDSIPSNPSQRMPLYPALRKRSDGTVVYDTDQCNLGRTHLIHNGQHIEALLSMKWGAWCENALRKLQNLDKNATQTLKQGKDPVAFEAWATCVFNRTNAEAMIDVLNKYADYMTFRRDFLQQSIASGYTGGRGLSEVGKTQESTFGPQAFALLRQYGYAMAKMMDLVSAVAHRSCKEVITSRAADETIQETLYGRTLATSTGKADKSSIIIGIRYANNAPILGSNDPQLMEIVQKHRQKSQVQHTAPDSDYIRKTKFPSRAAPMGEEFQAEDTWKIIYDLRFFVGLATSQSHFHKAIGPDDYETWDQALNVLLTRYPQIESELGVIIEPMNANLRELSSRFKKAMARVQKEMSQTSRKKVDFVVLDRENNTEEVLEGSVPTDIDPSVDPSQGPPAGPTTAPPVSEMTPPIPATPGSAAPGSAGPPPAGQGGPAANPQKPNFVGRQDGNKRRLLKQRPGQDTGKIKKTNRIEDIVRLADRLDQQGHFILAEKLDILAKLYK